MTSLAAKYLWWLTPDAARARPTLLLCQGMQLGTWDDYAALRAVVGDDAFQRALLDAPPGILDRKSWSFWTQFYKVEMPMPERAVPA